MTVESDQTELWPTWPVLGEEEKRAVERVVESNQLFAAEEVHAFESEFAAYLGVKHALGVGNATEGLQLALAALEIGVNDEIIVSPYSWISSATCAMMQNAVPVFADAEPESLGLSPEAAEAAITPRTKAIILVHMFGYPADVDGVMAVASRRGLPVVEDASHVHGAEYRGRKLGTYGRVGVFSFHQRKALCVGDGGMVVTDDDEIADRVYRLRSFGYSELSYNYRMTEFAAALGRVRLARLDADNQVRIANAERMAELLANTLGILVRRPRANSVGVYYRLLFEYEPDMFGVPLTEFVSALSAEGFPFAKTWEPLHRHPHFNEGRNAARGCPWGWDLYAGTELKGKDFKDLRFPVVEEYCDRRMFELPVHPPVGEVEIRRAADAILRALVCCRASVGKEAQEAR